MSAYNSGYLDGYQAAHDSYQEHEARLYAVAYASGKRAGINLQKQSCSCDGWAEQ